MRIAAILAAVLMTSCQSPRIAEVDDLTGAVRQGDVAAVRSRLRNGADPNRPAGVNDWPPLMHAVHKNQLTTAEVLLEGGADVNGSAPDGMTALMMAAAYGNDEMVRLLLRHHADPHLQMKDGANALDLALTGTTDIDKFTLFRCQDSTVDLLVRAHVAPKSSSRTFARFKRCAS
ncbi:MAG: hypothetical protein NVSMB68_09850 [Thermoanaerobaculia bacterium]